MKTENAQGRTICVAITAYMLLKVFVNFFIGGHFAFTDLIIAAVAGFFMFTGMEYVNYAVAGLLALGFISHLISNVIHITSQWFYLLEGFVDVGCAVLLILLPAVKEHFTNKWSEFPDIFKG